MVVYELAKRVFEVDFRNSIQLGRQRTGEDPPYTRVEDRVIIAPREETDISREHILVELLPESKVQITNRSQVNNITVGTDKQVAPGDVSVLALPTSVGVVGRVIQIKRKAVSHSPDLLASLPFKTIPPGSASDSVSKIFDSLSIGRSAVESERMLQGLQSTISLYQNATNVSEFFSMSAQALIDVGTLETAAALRWDGRRWQTEAILLNSGDGSSTDNADWAPSESVLQRVKEERRTFWRVPDPTASLMGVEALIAAPILDRNGEVIGALYGDRKQNAIGPSHQPIGELDALLVELLATSVASGISRLEHEQAAIQARVLFEQFFTPELSRQLESEPDLLLGKDTEVSLLFCDIRRLSEVSEQLGARLTIDWIQDVMETLSKCVAGHQGVLVDTLGDRLIGMWGAPAQRDDHAELACHAAIAMANELPALNRRWRQSLDQPVDLGIGVHTGMARVGNIGSPSKFKYGPLGTTVRITELVEQATRHLKVGILITEATMKQLSKTDSQEGESEKVLSTRRLSQIDGATNANPIDVYELAVDVSADWPEVKRRYESALDAIERGDLPTATSLLAKLLSTRPSDRAALSLMGRIDRSLMQ